MIDRSDWCRTSPFAALFFFGRIAKALAQNAWQTFAPLAAILFAYEGEMSSKLVAAVILMMVGAASAAVLQYWFFRYRITDDAVLIRQGVFQKKQLDIKFRRIQGINTEQNMVYRPLGLVTLSFDTAGSSGREGSLPAIRAEVVERLQSLIAATDTDVPGTAALPAKQREAFLTLGWRDMLRIGLSDRRALLVLAILAPMFERLDQQSQRVIERFALTAVSKLGNLGVTAGASTLVAFVFVAATLLAIVSISAAFLRYYNFKLYDRGGGLQTVGGLLTRHTSSMDASKIQMLLLKQGILLRLFGRFRAVLRQATSSGHQGSGKSMTLPIVEPRRVGALAKLAFAPELADLDLDPRSTHFQRISPYYMRARVLFYGLLPASSLTALNWNQHGVLSLLALLWLPFIVLMVFLIWRRHAIQPTADGMAVRSGFVGYQMETFLFRKVQRVTVSQSWLQRRRALASMRIYLASGSVHLRYIDHSLACRLRDQILFTVEASQRSWY